MSDAETIMLERLHDKDAVFVFPSEVAAEMNLMRLLETASLSVLPRRTCISWDRFKEETLASPPGRKPMNAIRRRLFLNALLTENARRPMFRSLIPPQYAAASEAHLSSFTPMLPAIGKIERLLLQGGAALPSAKREDLLLLVARYRSFLKEAGLFEPNDLPPAFTPGRKTYYIFYPEVIEDWDEIAPVLLGEPSVRVIEIVAAGKVPADLTLYDGIEDEIDALMHSLRGFLDNGCGLDRIAVTAAGLDEIALPLADAARRNDVPLCIKAGRPLAAYPGVNILTQVMDVVSSDFSLRSLKILLGNRSVPWKDPDAAEALIRFGLEHNCVRNYATDGRPFDLWEHHLRRLTAADGQADHRLRAAAALYRSLRTVLGSLTGAATFAETKEAFTKFRAVFLATERFSEPVRRCLDFAMQKLGELDETARTLPLPPPAAPFRVWLSLLEDADSWYVPPLREPGITVHPYRVSAGIRPDRHFIINVSEETTRVRISPFSFLSVDEQERLGISEKDVSDAFLSLYCVSGTRVTMSGARTCFGRVRLPPPYFVRYGGLREPASDAPHGTYAVEERFFLAEETTPPAPLFSLQASGLNAAAARSIGVGRGGVRFTLSPAAPPVRRRILERLTAEDGRLVITPTELENFTACAFRYLLEKAAGLTAEGTAFSQDEPLWRGSFIHNVCERFFRRLKETHGSFTVSERTRLKEDIRLAAAEEARAWEAERALPLPPVWRTEVLRLTDLFPVFIDNTADAFGDFEVLAVEKTYSVKQDKGDLTLKGKIDLVGRNGAGLIIIDYKKNNVPKKRYLLPEKGSPVSFQIPCYIILLEEGADPPAADRVAAASYYSYEGKKYHHVLHYAQKAWFTEEQKAQVISTTHSALSTMADRIRGGDFTIDHKNDQVSHHACRKCPFRAVCRRKYFLQFDD